MSEIAGIVTFDGAPIDDPTAGRMSARMEARGWSVDRLVVDNVALFFAGPPAIDGERQPAADPAGTLLITFDGRLDNREELAAKLGGGLEATDPSLALSAYRRWGAAFTDHLLGDFAIGLIDRANRRLVCARDALGIRRLHYRVGPTWIAFASGIDVLAAGIRPMPGINEGMAAEYLSSFIVSIRDTLFTDIFRVAPAHRLIASAGSLTLEEYWTPRPAALAGSSDAEYEEQFRVLLKASVAARMRGQRAVGVMLSGGLDSSAVTGMAASLVREGAVSTVAVETFSGSVPGPNDEQPFCEAVSRQWNLDSHAILERRPRAGQFEDEIRLELEPQVFPHSPTVDALRASVRSRGIRVLLTGMGADDWFGSSPCAYADLLSRGQLIALARRLRLEAGTDLFPEWRFALQGIVWPLLPKPLQDGTRQLLRRGRAPEWIDPDFARRTALADRLAQFRSQRRFNSYEQDDNWFQTMNGVRLHTGELVTRGGDRFGLDVSHPFFDRRLVEFGLSLPADQLWRDGRPKDLLRRAVGGFVPDVVRERRSSPSADHAFMHAIASVAGDRPFVDLMVERLGWINGTVVRSHWDAVRSAPSRLERESRILWGIQATDLWLHARTMVK